MKIGQTPDIHPSATTGTAAPPPKSDKGVSAAASAKAGALQGATSAGVSVTVSTLAQGLEKASLGQAAEVDAQKVATVKASIQDGTYVVNPEAIADKLLTNAQEMLQRTRS